MQPFHCLRLAFALSFVLFHDQATGQGIQWTRLNMDSFKTYMKEFIPMIGYMQSYLPTPNKFNEVLLIPVCLGPGNFFKKVVEKVQQCKFKSLPYAFPTVPSYQVSLDSSKYDTMISDLKKTVCFLSGLKWMTPKLKMKAVTDQRDLSQMAMGNALAGVANKCNKFSNKLTNVYLEKILAKTLTKAQQSADMKSWTNTLKADLKSSSNVVSQSNSGVNGSDAKDVAFGLMRMVAMVGCVEKVMFVECGNFLASLPTES